MPKFLDVTNTSAARAALGVTEVGDDLVTAADVAAARTVLGVSESQIADDLTDISSVIGEAAANTFVARSVSVDALLEQHADSGVPIIIPHRGAGDFLAPENVFVAWEIGASLGLGVLDGGDWRGTSDGALVSFHDATTNATTTKDRNVSDLTAMEASQLVVDCSSWFGGNFADTKIMTADQVFGTFGYTNVLMPEAKDTTAATLLAPIIAKMGIQASVIPNSFNWNDLMLFRDIGCQHLMVGITSMPSVETRALYLANGVNWVSVPWNGSITPTNVTTLLSEGFKVALYTVSRKAHLTQVHNWDAIKNDITAYWCADPIYFLHALTGDSSRYRRTTDPFITQTWYHGHIPGVDFNLSPIFRGEFRGTKRFGFLQQNVSPGDRYVLSGWGSPLASPTSWTLDYYLTYDTIGSDLNRWLAVVVGAPNDYGWSGGVGNTWESGYNCYLRNSGELNILKRTAGVNGTGTAVASSRLREPLVTTSALTAGVAITAIPVTAIPVAVVAGNLFRLPNDQIATVATGGAAIGATSIPVNSITPTETVASGSSLPQTVPMRITVTGTTVTFARLDSTAATATLTDGDHRGPYWYIGQGSTGAGQISGSFSDMVIT